MTVKYKYTYNDHEYTSLSELRQALITAGVTTFGNPKTDEGWAALNVTRVQYTVTPTEDEIKQALIDGVQTYLDTIAKQYGYDNCNSVCTYINTGVTKFDDEGKAFREWRSAVWAKCYQLLAEYQAGTIGVLTIDETIAQLPTLNIVYTETEETAS